MREWPAAEGTKNGNGQRGEGAGNALSQRLQQLFPSIEGSSRAFNPQQSYQSTGPGQRRRAATRTGHAA